MWLMQSFVNRYKKYIIAATLIGAVGVFALWKAFPYIHRHFFPDKTIVGIVGSYQPSELPLSIQRYISVGFTDIADSGEAEPQAVSKWEVSKEGTLYFFHLKQGIFWHDGQEFTAHDVNYKFKDVTIAPADRYTLKLELHEPFAPLPTLLSRPLFKSGQIGIIKSGLIGIGPYKVIKLDKKGEVVNSLVLKKSEEETIHVDTPYTTDLIEFRFYPSIEAAVLAFRMGEIDHIDNISSKTELASDKNVVVTEQTDRNRVLGVFYNLKDGILASKEFRQALSYATPKLEGEQMKSVLPSTSWAYNDAAKQYSQDMTKAKDLFDKSKIKDANITLSVFPEYLDQAEQIAASWRQLGITVNVQVVRYFPPDYQILLGVQEIPPDPDQYQLWHSTQEETNITHYNNPKIDKLLEEGRKLQTKEERIDVYKEFQRNIMEDNPANFLIHPIIYNITRK